MATRRAEPQDIDTLLDLLSEVDDHTTVEELVAHDVKFHGFINALSGNAYLASLLESLSSSTLRARIWRGLTEENSVARTLSEHRAIVAAMAAGDPDLARACSTVHISGVERWLAQAGLPGES
jgi:GntR family transcriptional repressor for pyruvate dehydrogenase complex